MKTKTNVHILGFNLGDQSAKRASQYDSAPEFAPLSLSLPLPGGSLAHIINHYYISIGAFSQRFSHSDLIL